MEISQLELMSYLHLLHFSPTSNQSPQRVFLLIKNISKTIKVTPQQVSILLMVDLALPNNRKALKKRPSPMLSPENFAYLASPASHHEKLGLQDIC